MEVTLLGADVDGDALAFTVGTAPGNGSVTCVGAVCTYTPAANFHGSDSFTSVVTAAGRTATGTVSVTVTPVGDAPVAGDDTASTAEDTAVEIDVLGDDSDVDGDTLSVRSVTVPSSGTAAVGPGRSVTYTPAANFCGQATFSYTVGDPTLTDTAAVTVTVDCVNDPPVANPDSGAVGAGGTVAVNVLGNDTDVDGDTLSGSGSGTTAAGGTYSCGTPACSYTAAAGATATDTFTYTVSDGHGGTATGTVTVTFGNADPHAADIAVTTDEDVAVEVTLTASDANGDTLTFAVATNPSSGTVTCSGTACTYTPAANTSGTDSFTYTVSDGHGGSDTATVTVTVRPVNDAPTISGSGPVSRPEGSTALLAVTVNDVDSSAFTYLWAPPARLDDATVRTPTFSAVDDGTFPFAVQVCDTASPAACTSLVDAASVTVTNVAPVVDAVSRHRRHAWGRRSRRRSPRSPMRAPPTPTRRRSTGATAAPSTDRSAVTGQVGASHTYAAAGTYTIRICVTDDDGGSSCDTTVARITSPSVLPTVSIADSSVEEGDSGTTTMSFKISLSASSAAAVKVAWSTAPGTATPGTDPIAYPEDYRSASGTATIPAGSTHTTVQVKVSGDLIAEGAETFFVDLSGPVGAVIGDGHAVGTITEKLDVCTVIGTNGADTLVGTQGKDVLCGLGGHDTYNPRGGDDVIIDTSGSDTLTYDLAPNGVVVDLVAGRATGWGTDTFQNIEHVIGSSHADQIDGTDGGNKLDGRAGNDRLSGRAGIDVLLGGAGDDRLEGGSGLDWLDGGTGNDRSDGGSDIDVCVIGSRGEVRVSCELP